MHAPELALFCAVDTCASGLLGQSLRQYLEALDKLLQVCQPQIPLGVKVALKDQEEQGQ